MSRHIANRRLLVRFLAAIFGTGLLAYLIWRIGPSTLAQDVSTLGWGLALVIALGGVAHVVKAWAWRFTLSGEEHKVSFPRLAPAAIGVRGSRTARSFRPGIRGRTSSLSSERRNTCRLQNLLGDPRPRAVYRDRSAGDADVGSWRRRSPCH